MAVPRTGSVASEHNARVSRYQAASTLLLINHFQSTRKGQSVQASLEKWSGQAVGSVSFTVLRAESTVMSKTLAFVRLLFQCSICFLCVLAYVTQPLSV